MSTAAAGAAGSSRQASSIEWPGLGVRVAALVVSTVIGSFLALGGLATPPPAPKDASSFSAERAMGFARALLGDEPRPAGSAANAAAALRLTEWLRARGLEVESSEAKVRANGRDVTIRNVLARKTGAMPGPAILLCAHHDSAAASPGAGDDGFGVGVLLEMAAALGSGPWPGRDIILLFTDGEESGLLGARHFVNNHPWHAKVGAVINVDNRGNSGPSILYDVCGDSADLLQACSTALGPVVGSSLYAEIASRMPNSSDLSVFREAGMSGMNFAVIGGHEHYHAPSDDWKTADLSSLQHQGEVTLTAAQALAAHRHDSPKAEGGAVYQDIAGQMLAWWPVRAGITASIGCVALLSVTGLVAVRRMRVSLRHVALGWFAAGVRFLVAGVAAWIILQLGALAGLHGMETATAALPDASLAERYKAAFWPSHGPLVMAGTLAASLTAAWFASRPLLRGREPLCGFIGAWAAFAVFAAFLAVVLPGASAPILPIVLLASLPLVASVFLMEGREHLGVLATIAVGGFLTGLMLAPVEALGWLGVGLSMPEFAALRAATLALALLPALTPRSGAATR